MATHEENVLVIRRVLFDKLGAFPGLCKTPGHYIGQFLRRENNSFMPRSRAERDPTFKQLIPYVVFVHEGRVLHYVRGGSSGEKRLVAKGSIGIGGHINDADESLFAFDEGAYHAAVRREISEELKIAAPWEERVVGLINDDSTEVGQVHLGVVHRVELSSADVQAGEKAIAQLGFLEIADLRSRHETLETWSQILVDAWEDIGSSS